MRETVKVQQEAVSVISKEERDLYLEIDQLADLTNVFDVEAKLFGLARRAEALKSTALLYHKRMREAIATEPLQETMFDRIFKK